MSLFRGDWGVWGVWRHIFLLLFFFFYILVTNLSIRETAEQLRWLENVTGASIDKAATSKWGEQSILGETTPLSIFSAFQKMFHAYLAA